jgi:DNA-binding protein HU-alpha
MSKETVGLSEVAHAVAVGEQLTEKLARAATKAAFGAVTGMLQSGKAVTIKGFGTFSVREVKPRTMKSFQTGQPIQTAGGRRVHFKTSKSVKEGL